MADKDKCLKAVRGGREREGRKRAEKRRRLDEVEREGGRKGRKMAVVRRRGEKRKKGFFINFFLYNIYIASFILF